MSGKLLYRYDKIFSGKIIQNERENFVHLNYHVRPMNTILDYDWVKLETDLKKNNLIKLYQEGRTFISICSIKELVEFWLRKINEDPFYLLEKNSKFFFKKEISRIGRALEINDYE